MKPLITTAKAIGEGLFFWLLVTLFGAIFNWIGFSLFLTNQSGFIFWTLTITIIYIICPLSYLYFGFFYAQKVVFRRFYQDNQTITLGLSKLIMRQVIRVVKQNGSIEKEKLEIKKLLNEYVKGWPWIIRVSLKTILFFIPLWDMIKDLDKNKMTDTSIEEISQQLHLKIDEYIKEELLSRFPWFTIWLLPLNVLFMYLIQLTG